MKQFREREALHPQDVLDNLANFSDCFINNWHSCLYTLDVVLVNLINYFRLLFDHMRWNEHFCEHLSVQIFSDDFTRKIITQFFFLIFSENAGSNFNMLQCENFQQLWGRKMFFLEILLFFGVQSFIKENTFKGIFRMERATTHAHIWLY